MRAVAPPVVNVTLIVANFAVFLFYELPNGEAAVNQASFYPCDVDNACHTGLPWGVAWDHGHVHACRLGSHPRQHAVPGDLRQEVFYFAAMMLQTGMTLLFGTTADAQIPNLGASGAIAATYACATRFTAQDCAVPPGSPPGWDRTES